MSPSRSRKSALRTVDVARRVGYSVQQVRDLENAGVLPPATRSPAGYRAYAEEHVRAAQAYRLLAAAVGPVEARTMMRAAYRSPTELLHRLDEAHAALHAQRRDLALAVAAAGSIAAERIDDPRPADAMTISELAGALGLRPSTLRHWDAEGLVVPQRVSAGGARSYSPRDVRDARIVSQLRWAGHGIGPLKELLPQLRSAERWADVVSRLEEREAALDARSRALLQAAAALWAVLEASTEDAAPHPDVPGPQPDGGTSDPGS
ncbi:UNVERIFIED_ORG: MerR family transcriptional regulator [Bacillus sp. AZ43]